MVCGFLRDEWRLRDLCVDRKASASTHAPTASTVAPPARACDAVAVTATANAAVAIASSITDLRKPVLIRDVRRYDHGARLYLIKYFGLRLFRLLS